MRQRVVLTEEELNCLDPAYRLTDDSFERLGNWIESNYRDTLTLDDLADPAFADEAISSMAEFSKLLRAS